MSIIVGLLVGHWITQSKAPSTQIVKVEGLTSGAAPAAAASATAPPTTTHAEHDPRKPAAESKASAKEEAKDVKEAKAIEKAPVPKAVIVTPANFRNSVARPAKSTRKKSTSSAPSRSKRAARGQMSTLASVPARDGRTAR